MYTKKPDEGGADAIYDGAVVSDFERAVSSARPSSNFAQQKPRFDNPEAAIPEVDVRQRGIADSAQGKGLPAWEARKPRFEDPKPAPPDYDVPSSSFEKAMSNKPSPMMVTPEKNRTRGSWMENPDHIASPAPGEVDLPGAFNIKNKPSPFTSSGSARFKDTQPMTFGEPDIDASMTSDFAKAASKTKPSPSSMSASARFRNDVVSYGDPGAQSSSADLDRQQLEARIARQRNQAEAKAQRDLEKYN